MGKMYLIFRPLKVTTPWPVLMVGRQVPDGVQHWFYTGGDYVGGDRDKVQKGRM